MDFSPRSRFQMKEYKIHKLLLDNAFISDYSQDCVELSYFASLKYVYLDNHWEGSIFLGFRQVLNRKEQEETAPLPLYESIIVGDFVDDSDQSSESEAEFVKKLRINGTSTLIPILRAAICSASAMMGFPNKYILPNINVYALKWKNDNDKSE